MKSMFSRQGLAKIVSVALIVFSLYQIVLSLNSIFFIYPRLDFGGQDSALFEEGLVEKAFVIYLTLITSGIYGVTLLFKPAEKVKIIHILFGILIFIISVFFVARTPFTTDPIWEFIKQLLTLKSP